MAVAAVYEAKLPPQQLNAELDRIASMAEAAKASRKRLRIASGVLFVAAFVMILAGSVVASSAITTIGVLSMFACVVLFIYSFLHKRGLNGYAERVQLLRGGLDIFLSDADNRQPVSVRLALKADPTLKAETAMPRRRNGKQKIFEEELFSFEYPLLDGTVAEESLTEITRKRTYTNPRGKSKSKSRTRHIVTLRLKYPTKVYGDIRPIAKKRPASDLKTPPSALLREVRVTEKSIVLKALVRSATELKQTMGMLALGAYRILNLSRQVARKQRGQA